MAGVIRVTREIVYEGDCDWIRKTLERSLKVGYSGEEVPYGS